MKYIFTFAALSFLHVSCVPQSLTGDSYSRNEVGQAQTIERGHVTSVRYVKIQAGSTAGSIIGGLAGGFLGSEVGGGTGAKIATVGGAGVGALAGGAAEQKLRNRQGVELNIDLNNGRSVSITQEVSKNERFSVGDHVCVIYGSGRTRVAH